MLDNILWNLKKHSESGKTKGLRSPVDKPEPLDEVQQSPRQKTPKKDVYGCFLFFLYSFDFWGLENIIDKHERLEMIDRTSFLDLYNDEMMERARRSDILLLSSGSGVFDIDCFLKEIDISRKVVIIVSSYSPASYAEWIKSRIDYHMPKEQIYNTVDFSTFMKKVLKELDG